MDIRLIVAIIAALASILGALFAFRAHRETMKHNLELRNIANKNEKDNIEFQAKLDRLAKLSGRNFHKKADTLDEVFKMLNKIHLSMEEYVVPLTTLGKQTGKEETLKEISDNFAKLYKFYRENQIYIPDEIRLGEKLGNVMGRINQIQNKPDDWENNQKLVLENYSIIKEMKDLIKTELNNYE